MIDCVRTYFLCEGGKQKIIFTIKQKVRFINLHTSFLITDFESKKILSGKLSFLPILFVFSCRNIVLQLCGIVNRRILRKTSNNLSLIFFHFLNYVKFTNCAKITKLRKNSQVT